MVLQREKWASVFLMRDDPIVPFWILIYEWLLWTFFAVFVVKFSECPTNLHDKLVWFAFVLLCCCYIPTQACIACARQGMPRDVYAMFSSYVRTHNTPSPPSLFPCFHLFFSPYLEDTCTSYSTGGSYDQRTGTYDEIGLSLFQTLHLSDQCNGR